MPGLLSSLNCSANRGSSERGGGPFFSSEERVLHDIPCKAATSASERRRLHGQPHFRGGGRRPATYPGRPLGSAAIWESIHPKPLTDLAGDPARGGPAPPRRPRRPGPLRRGRGRRRHLRDRRARRASGWRPSSPSGRPRSPSTRRTAGLVSPAGDRAEWVLVVDPIDGTRPALAGLESCCVSVAAAPLDVGADHGRRGGRLRAGAEERGELRRRAGRGAGAGAAALGERARWSGCSGPTASGAARRGRWWRCSPS